MSTEDKKVNISKPKGRKTSKYKVEMCEQYLEMCKNGKLPCQIAAAFGVTTQTLLNWSDDIRKPEFSRAHKLGADLRKAYWVELGRRGASGEITRFNAATYNFMMSAMYDEFRKVDSTKLEVTNKYDNMSPEELDKIIAQSASTIVKLKHESD